MNMKYLFRTGFYTLGLCIITIGINLSIISNLGISPVSAFTYPLSEATHISLGTITILTYSCLVCIQIILLKREFKLKDLLQIPFSFCFGFFVDMTGEMMAWIMPRNYVDQLILMILGIVICSIGAAMYILMDIVPNAPEGFNLAVAKHFTLPFSKSKIISDCIFISLGILISMLAFHHIIAIREGTIISALLTGKMIGFCTPYLKRVLEPLVY